MSAHTELQCVNCGADSEHLDPKHGVGDNVYSTECGRCGHRDLYVWPSDDDEVVGD